MSDYARPIVSLSVVRGRYASTNNGATDHYDDLLLFPAGTRAESVDPDQLDRAVRMVSRVLSGQTVLHLEPVQPRPEGSVGWMFGGNYAVGDSRFNTESQRISGVRFYGAMAVHDRCETVKQYAAGAD